MFRNFGQFFGETHRQETVNGLSLSENSYRPDQTTAKHTHEATLLYFVLQGICKETTATHSSAHFPTTLVYLPAGEPHATHWSSDAQGSCFHLEVSAEYDLARLLGRAKAPESAPRFFSDGPQPLLARKLYREFRSWDQFSPLIAEGILLEIFGHIERSNAEGLGESSRWLKTVESSLREQFASPPSLAELSSMVDVHASHLVRAFRQRFHKTPGEFVRQIRIQEACRLLAQEPAIPLGELALKLGFSDQSHFSRTFRKVMGSSPGEYRRKICTLR